MSGSIRQAAAAANSASENRAGMDITQGVQYKFNGVSHCLTDISSSTSLLKLALLQSFGRWGLIKDGRPHKNPGGLVSKLI